MIENALSELRGTYRSVDNADFAEEVLRKAQTVNKETAPGKKIKAEAPLITGEKKYGIMSRLGYMLGAAAFIAVFALGIKFVVDNGGLVEGGPQAADTNTTAITEENTTITTSEAPVSTGITSDTNTVNTGNDTTAADVTSDTTVDTTVETTADTTEDTTIDTTAPTSEDAVTETAPAEEQPTDEELLAYLSQGPEVWGYTFTVSDVNKAGLMMHFKRDVSAKWADKYIISAGDFIIETLDEGGDWVTYEPELQKKWGYPDWLLEYDTEDIAEDDIPAQFYGEDELGGNELPNGRYRIRLPIAAVIAEDFPTSRRDPHVSGSAYAEFDITDETPNVFGMSFKVTNVTSGRVTIEVKQDKSEFGTEWYHALSYQAKLGYLAPYSMQQYVGGKWVAVTPIGLPGWSSMIFPVEADGVTVIKKDFSALYDRLANGRYRIAYTFVNYYSGGGDDYNSASVLNEKTCYIEFEVTDGETHWGITLEAKEVTATGMTLVINEWGGRYSGDVTYGTSFGVERLENGEWTTVPDISDNYGWTLIAYSLPRNSVTEEKENWGYHLGALPPGRYRISKEFSDGDNRSTKTFYAEFELTEETGSRLGVSMLRNNNTANDIELLVIQHGGTVEGDITYDPAFTIERDNGGKWEELPTQSGMPAVWNTPATLPVLPRDETTTITAKWDMIYGTNCLSEGRYRIGKTFSCGAVTETVYAEFTVTMNMLNGYGIGLNVQTAIRTGLEFEISQNGGTFDGTLYRSTKYMISKQGEDSPFVKDIGTVIEDIGEKWAEMDTDTAEGIVLDWSDTLGELSPGTYYLWVYFDAEGGTPDPPFGYEGYFQLNVMFEIK